MAGRGVTKIDQGSTDTSGIFRTTIVTLGGVQYTLRELSVKENDACVAAAKQPDGSFDGRTMMRFMVLKSVVEPKMSDTALLELPQRLYLRFCDVVSDLNADDDVESDAEFAEDQDEAKNA